MGLAQLINIQISRETQAVSQAGFGTPLIVGSNKTAAGVGSYSSLADVLAEPGLTTGTDEYKAAAKIFAQTPHPLVVKIAKLLAKVAQVDTITPVAVDTHHYIVTIVGRKNGVPFSLAYDYTSDGSATIGEIVAGLTTLINADSTANGVTASGSTTLILTANTAGQPFTTSVSDVTNMALVHTTANVGVVEGLVDTSLNHDDDWYGLISTFRSKDDILNIADYIEALPKLFGVSVSDVNAYDASSTTDIPYLIKHGNYFRSWAFYSADAANYPEASEFGRCLPTTPGSETWAFKTLATTPVDALNATQINALKAKNCNYYISLGGRSITLDGKVAGGDFIDIIRLIDAITADQMERIFGLLVRTDKVPYTNGGITSVQNQVEGSLKSFQKTGGVAPDDVDSDGNIVPGYSTSFPKVSDVSPDDRANRILSGGSWQARLAGAIHAADINATVTV